MTHSADPIRVLLVDDHEFVRRGVSAMLQEEPGIMVVGEAASAEAAVAAVERAHPQVVVMDVQLSDRTGIEATRDIRAAHPEVRVIMLTAFADDEAVYASLVAGASGYVLKRTRADDLVAAIRTVCRGESLLDPAVTETVLEHLRRGGSGGAADEDRLARLSPQEDRVLDLVADGKTNREIARLITLSEKTVKNYVSDILAKLEVARRAEAAAYLAARRGQVRR